MKFHSTWLKKIYSRVFETNVFRDNEIKTSDVITPIIALEPEEVLISGNNIDNPPDLGNPVIFNVPSDRDFFITSINMMALITELDSGGVSARMELTDRDDKVLPIAVFGNQSLTVLEWQPDYARVIFSKAGLLLKKGSDIKIYIAGSTWCRWEITGYYGSDRS